MLAKLKIIFASFLLTLTSGCGDSPNDPYPEFQKTDNTLYTAFLARPKHLDPAISYSTDEAIFTYQVYEPPLQYHYLKMPYELIPLVAEKLPSLRYEDNAGHTVAKNAPNLAFTIYQIKIKPGIFYQPHPAFAKDEKTDHYLYHQLTDAQISPLHTLGDFPKQSTRELIAEDFLYGIKRLADPTVNSPIYGFMEKYIAGLSDYSKQLGEKYEAQRGRAQSKYLDLRTTSFAGVRLIDRYTYEVKIKGQYPQFSYWLAMPFFAPMPWEAIKFYAQPGLAKKNISLDWYPIGTGPFVLKENNPNLQMILERNPHYHGELYPSEGEPGDTEKGLLQRAGQKLPFVDKIVFALESESIPYWSKFLQGYYDSSAVTSANFDQALKSSASNLELNDDLKNKGIRLNSSVMPAIFYWGVNMTDETVGGYSAAKKKLRQALAIVLDMEEYINIFVNGSGIVSQSPIPPGIFGYEAGLKGINPYTYNIDQQKGTYARKSLDEAKKLLTQAGYPGGIDPKTKQPLILFLDTSGGGDAGAQAQFAWTRKQFKKIGIELVIRATDYNRFQDKMNNGDFQLYSFGWVADYPDPENFLFLLYGENGKLKYGGQNTNNYQNPAFDALFEKMKNMDNSTERAHVLQKMIDILQEDMTWIGGYHPKLYSLRQQWLAPTKPNAMTRYSLKYISLAPEVRQKYRLLWNKPTVWPMLIGLGVFFILCIPAYVSYRRKMHRPLTLRPRS